MAAIASASAGKLYGLEILKKAIQDDPRNYTRFVTVAKKGMDSPRQMFSDVATETCPWSSWCGA